MFRYILKRLLIFVPTFFIISLLIFGLSKMAPGDPVELLLKGGTNAGNTGQRADLANSERMYAEKAKELGLDRPTFYFSFTSAAYPKALYQIKKQTHRETLSRLIGQYGDSDEVLAYYEALRTFELACSDVGEGANYEAQRTIRSGISEVYLKYEDSDIMNELNNIKAALPKDPMYAKFQPKFDSLVEKYELIKKNASSFWLYVPTIHWYGFKNQYHTWMFGDRPWTYSVDSTPYKKVIALTAQVRQLGKIQDSLIQVLKPTCTKHDLAKQELDSLTKQSNPDSLRQVVAQMHADSVRLGSEIGKLATEIAAISSERDSLDATLEKYASYGFLRFDFGKSYLDSRPVSTKMKEALFWTLIMNFFSIFLSYIVSIPLGVQSGVWKKNQLQMFQFISFGTLLSSLLITSSMLLYNMAIIDKKAFLLLVASTVVLYLVYELLANVRHVHERETIGGKIWAIVYSVSIGMVLLWAWVLLEAVVAMLLYLFMYAPKLGITVAFVVVLGIAWKMYQNRKTGIRPEKLFSLSKAGIMARGSVLDNIATAMLFIFYSLPSFWIGTILIVFLTAESYGMNWFPTGGVRTLDMMQNAKNYSQWEIMTDTLHHLILPIFCMTYGSFAFLSRQMRGAMLGVIRQDYIRTAYAKGLSEEKVVWKHAFRNSLFPIITQFGSIFPHALSGSIAIELIYSIPGMGSLALGSIVARDWPVVFTIAMFAAILTMIGNLIADMLYSVADPRVSFK